MSQAPPPPPPPGAPPPPPPPGAPPGGAPYSVGDAVSYGWSAYWKNVGPLVVITLVIFAVQFLISIVSNATDSAVGQALLQVISFLVAIILAMGLIRASLAVCEGRKPEVSMLDADGRVLPLPARLGRVRDRRVLRTDPPDHPRHHLRRRLQLLRLRHRAGARRSASSTR